MKTVKNVVLDAFAAVSFGFLIGLAIDDLPRPHKAAAKMPTEADIDRAIEAIQRLPKIYSFENTIFPDDHQRPTMLLTECSLAEDFRMVCDRRADKI